MRGHLSGKTVGVVIPFLCLLLLNSAPAAAAKKAPVARGPAKQIYELSHDEQPSSCLGASGVAAYVVSGSGTNRGLLIRNVNNGFAAAVGIQSGDVLLSINSRVVQTGKDADRILTSLEPGPGRIVFVHPSSGGLQLYNVPVNLPRFSASAAPPSFSSGTSSSSASSGRGANDATMIPVCESYMLELVNSDRRKHNSNPVQANSVLAAFAKEKAQDMGQRGYFGHTDPDGVGPKERAARDGIKCGVYENIAFQNGIITVREAVQMSEQGMMSEPPNQQNHRSNILDPNHACCGIGIARGKNGAIYTVQEFADVCP